MIEPLRVTFEVSCSVEHAFYAWTDRIDAWWPADHTASGEPDATIVLEPRVGGRLYERTVSGEEHDWGEVTRWDPPGAFAYLWHLRRDRADATDVHVEFTAVPAGTRVDIVHSGWERLGAEGQTWRDRNGGGWATLLPHFQDYAERTQK
jgi:hypothetical protein